MFFDSRASLVSHASVHFTSLESDEERPWHGQSFQTHQPVHFTKDLVNVLTVHSKWGPPIRARYRHFRIICAYIGASSPVLLQCLGLNR